MACYVCKKSRARSARRLPDLVSYLSSVPFCVRPPGEPPDLERHWPSLTACHSTLGHVIRQSLGRDHSSCYPKGPLMGYFARLKWCWAADVESCRR